jgi:hypothetical protein
MSTEEEKELDAAVSSERPEDLSEELARKWDPERIMRMFARRAGKGESLDHSLRQRYEARFGVDLGHVRIITGEFAEEFNKQRGSNAVTIGNTGMILMGGHADKSPLSADGQALLAHEVAHVAQAERGMHFDRNDAPLASDEHEQEAEAVEAEEHAHATGHAAHNEHMAGLHHEATKAKLLEDVTQKVMDMFAEATRVDWERNGRDPRRP